MASRRFGCHQTRQVRVCCWTCGGVVTTSGYSSSTRWIRAMVLATVSTCRARRCLSRRSSVRRSWMRLVARPPCCHEAGGLWTWMRLCRSSVQLPCPAPGQCYGIAPVSTSLARHHSGQRLSVRRPLMVAQACRQHAPRRLMYAACRLAVIALTRAHRPQCHVDAALTRKQVIVDQSSCRGCGPSCSRRTFASATSPM